MVAKRKLILVSIFIGVIAVLGAGFFFLGWEEKPPISSVYQKSEQHKFPLMKVVGVKFTQLNNQGQKLWVLQAEEATKYPQRTMLKNAKLKLYEQGEPASEGTADEVVIDASTSDLLLSGDIHVKSFKENAEIETSELRWDSSQNKFFTEQRVTIKKGGLIIQGKGLIGNPDLSSITIKDQVTTYIEGGNE